MSDKHRDGRRPFYAIARDVAAGRPKYGGLGLFPWEFHIAARHARWAARLISSPLSVAWAGLLRALIYDFCGREAHPIILFNVPPELRAAVPALGRLPATLGKDATSGPWNNVPNVLARLAIGARSLGPLKCLVSAPLPMEGGGLELVDPLPTEWSQASVLSIRNLQAISNVVHTVGFIPHEKSEGVAILPSIERPPDVRPSAAQSQAAPPGTEKQKTGPSALTVRCGTQLLISRHCEPVRKEKWTKFIQVAAGLHCDGESAGDLNDAGPTAPVPAAPVDIAQQLEFQLRGVNGEFQSIRGIFTRVWSISWSNPRKEILWRLVYNGIPTPVRLGLTQRRCPCNTMPHSPPGRPHVFWNCPIAVAVRDHIVAALPRPPRGRARLSREHIWLCRPPQPGILQLFWDVICLAALGAMDYGRRVLLSLVLQHDSSDDASSISENISSSVDADLHFLLRAQRAAVAHFFTALADFCSVTRTNSSKLAFVSVEARERHPLLRLRPPLPAAEGAPPIDSDPPRGSVFAVVVPLLTSLPQRDNLREMSLSRATAGPSNDEILKARILDENSGVVLAGPAVVRGGVIENMVFCVCGSWRSALRLASENPDHAACGAG